MMASVAHQNSSQDENVKAVLRSTKMKHPADIDPLQMKNHTKIFMNGDWLGVCKLTETNDIYQLLKDKRNGGVIDKYTTISLDYNKREIKVYFDGGRLIRPIMIVEDNKLGITKEVMTRARAKGYDGILQYRNGELSEVVAFSPNQIKSAFNQKPTYRSDILAAPSETSAAFKKAPPAQPISNTLDLL
jgi:DNA-directed RNA polymerase beta subunit